MIPPNNIDAFYALLRAGLWENSVKFTEDLEWNEIYQLAAEQSVIGVVLVGIEHSNVKPPQELLLQWIGEVQILEQQNKAMNQFITELIERMQKADICTLLVKGQGIAQCYERPLWRSIGDVDFLLNDTYYERAKDYLSPLATSIATEEMYGKHFGITMGGWVVELHGTLRSGLSHKMDKLIDEVQRDVFLGHHVRTWQNGMSEVILPSADNDVLFIFTHFLKHFFKEGVGVRQICDWCRLLWTFKNSLDNSLLESRIRKAGLMAEWKAFAAFAVDYLGMQEKHMPLYDSADYWKNKARQIGAFIIEEGCVAQNRDYGFYEKSSYLMRKLISMKLKCENLQKIFSIFPWSCISFFPYIMFNGVRSVVRGEG